MLKTAKISRTSASDRLIKLWTDRYLPDLSAITPRVKADAMTDLVVAASETGRKKTVERVRRKIQTNCEMAGLETNALFAYIPNVINLAETRALSTMVAKVYAKILQIYASQQPPNRYLAFMDSSNEMYTKLVLPSLMLPTITRLAEELTPSLIELQQHYQATSDSRAVGFLTTQFHFSNRELLKYLSASELILFTPYLKFVEEQVCIPWQRICAAAARHLSSSTGYRIVEQLLPCSQAIAIVTYDRTIGQHQTHQSRRGRLTNPEIRASTLRDLCMVQGYLFLCLLEGDMSAIQNELLPLCILVFPSIDVKWELVNIMLNLLAEELLARVASAQRRSLLPYTEALLETFAMVDTHFCRV